MTASTALVSRPLGARWRAVLLGAAIFLLTVAAFSRLIVCDFTWWDDPDTIHHNPLLNPPTLASVGHYWTAIGPNAPMSLYVPVTYTVWVALAKIAHRDVADAGGLTLDPHVFHAANVLLHAMAAVAAFALLRRLTRWDSAAAVGAMVFALHPVQVEAVGWVSGTKDVLCGLFSIAALWQYAAAVEGCALAPSPGNPGEGGGAGDFEPRESFYARNHPHPNPLPDYRERGPDSGRWILAAIFLVLAILSKPTAVIVPLMAIAIGRLLLRRPWMAIARTIWPWLMIAVAGAITARWSQSAPWASPLPIWDRPGIAADALAFYLGKLFWPAHLCPDYGHRPAAVVADGWFYFTWVLPAALAVLLWMLRRRWPIGLTAGWLFLLPLVPVLGLTPFMFQFLSTTADHYLYLAMLGPALLVTWAVATWGGRAAVAAVVVLIALAVRTLFQEAYWQDTRTLFEHTLVVNPRSFTACDLLGEYHHEQYRQMALEATRARSAGAMAIALELLQQGREQLLISLDFYERGLAIYPQYVPSLVNMATVNMELGRRAEARTDIHRVLQLQPQIPEVFRANRLGLAQYLVALGDPEEAIPLLEQILRQDPANRQAANLRAMAVAALRHSAATQQGIGLLKSR